jgi:tetratricopeptide (TPR) repeat protein
MDEVPGPSGSDGQLARVRELLRQGDLAGAEAIVNDRLARRADDAEALYMRALIASRQRDYPAAIASLQRMIAIDPDSSLGWLALGNAQARIEEWAAAAESYRTALTREPGWVDAHFNLGLVLRRSGDLRAAARALRTAWSLDPMLFDAARQCVATIADYVRRSGTKFLATATDGAEIPPESVTVVICSIDDAKHDRAVALYRRLFAGVRHEIVTIRDARSLAEAYNGAIAQSTADVVVLSHDDVDVLESNFAGELLRGLRTFDAVGVVGSTRMEGPALGWSGHPHLRGWITHHAAGDPQWHVDVLHPAPGAGDIAILDGVMIAARREVFAAVPFDARTFDGFHHYDLDWSYRASRAGFRLGVAGDLLVVHASRGNYGGAVWERYANRFCAKHGAGGTEPKPSSFFGATLDTAEQARAFFACLAQP